MCGIYIAEPNPVCIDSVFPFPRLLSHLQLLSITAVIMVATTIIATNIC